MVGRARSVGILGLVVVTLAAVPALAAPSGGDDSAAQCVADAAIAQRTRDDGHLSKARALFVRCAADQCPSLVKHDCVQWLAEVDERLPSIVVSIRGKDGGDPAGAQVVLDANPLPAGTLGRSLQLDPGQHTFRVTAGGYESKTETVMVAEREKGRAVAIILTPLARPVELTREVRRVPLLSWVLGGVALAGGAGFGVFWWRATDEVSSLRQSCAPYCTDAQIDDARTPITISRVSLGIGIGAAIAAVAVYALSRPIAEKTR